MKKMRVLVMVMVFMLCFSTVTMAISGASNKNVNSSVGQPAFEATIVIEPDSPVIYVNDTVSLTATWTTNRDITRTQWYINDLGQGEEQVSGTGGTSSFDFSSAEAGEYSIDFRVWHHNENQSDRDAIESVTVTVVVPDEKQVIDFDIIASHFEKQGNTHGNNPTQDNKYKLIITELFVEYSDDSSESVELDEEEWIEVGGFELNQPNRKFDVVYGGCVKQFIMNGPTEE